MGRNIFLTCNPSGLSGPTRNVTFHIACKITERHTSPHQPRQLRCHQQGSNEFKILRKGLSEKMPSQCKKSAVVFIYNV